MNKIKFEMTKTSSFIVLYSLYLYLLGLDLRNTSKTVIVFKDENRSYVSVWHGIQRFGSLFYKRKKVPVFIVDETVIKIGNQFFRLLICIESIVSDFDTIILYMGEALPDMAVANVAEKSPELVTITLDPKKTSIIFPI